MTEQELDGHLFRAAKGVAPTLGWTSFHVLRSKGSRAGFPDRVAWRDRVIYAELKSADGKPTPAQAACLTALAAAGAEVYLWRPSDMDEVDRVLGYRWRIAAGHLLRAFERPWRPGSLWMPQGGRADALGLADAA